MGPILMIKAHRLFVGLVFFLQERISIMLDSIIFDPLPYLTLKSYNSFVPIIIVSSLS